MRINVFPDPRGSGEAVRREALNRGYQASASLAPEAYRDADAAYIRTLNYGGYRSMCLDALTACDVYHVPCVPGADAHRWYDDKRPQVAMLDPWSPGTALVERPPNMVLGLDYPFVSKAAQGSASKNVRLVRTQAEAEAEIAAAFGAGIPLGDGSRQQGYLIWQEFVPGNDSDLRVVVAGDRLLGLYRQNRPDRPFASGSGLVQPVTALGERERAAFAMAQGIAAAINAPWSCYDFVFDADGRPLVLEVSTSWTEAAYDACPCFGPDLEPTGETAKDWPRFAVDLMERLGAN